jgi:ankyrin repeat protein
MGVVSALVSAGADVNWGGDIGVSALLVAAAKDRFDMVSFLISARSDVNYVSSIGITPLLAAVHGNVRIVSALINAGAHVNYTSPKSDVAVADQTAMDFALDRGDDALITVLKDAGAVTWGDMIVNTNELFSIQSTGEAVFDMNRIDSASDKDRENALRFGVPRNFLAAVKPLLAAGVNPSILYRGTSLLSVASSVGLTDIVKELIDAGADLKFKDSDGKTALQHAAKNKHRDVVALLLAKAKELKKMNQ